MVSATIEKVSIDQLRIAAECVKDSCGDEYIILAGSNAFNVIMERPEITVRKTKDGKIHHYFQQTELFYCPYMDENKFLLAKSKFHPELFRREEEE